MAKTIRLQPQVTLDMRGSACPGPMLGAKRVLEDLLAGEVMLLISDCPASKDDLASWPKYADVEIVKTEKRARGVSRYFIRKGKTRRIAPNAVLDMRGSTCPGPIVEAKKLLNGMRKGEVLQLVSDCPGARADVRSWVKATGLELAHARERAPGEFEFQIRKR
jgi:tRNA 2-thiouridine synthesizing protein A